MHCGECVVNVGKAQLAIQIDVVVPGEPTDRNRPVGIITVAGIFDFMTFIRIEAKPRFSSMK